MTKTHSESGAANTLVALATSVVVPLAFMAVSLAIPMLISWTPERKITFALGFVAAVLGTTGARILATELANWMREHRPGLWQQFRRWSRADG